VETDFFHSAKYIPDEVNISDAVPALKSEDISNAIMFLLSTDYRVNVTEITVRPVGESF
jgi:NADP-dependent 3-hydroxy acid dehydrogenase YdfG